jgi:uncharacterized protein YkwD
MIRLKRIIFLLLIPALSNAICKANVADMVWDLKTLDTARNSDYLTEEEKNVVLELNMARTNPAQYAEMYIKPMLDKFQGNKFWENGYTFKITVEGTSSVMEALDVMKTQLPCCLLTPDKGLTEMARYHCTAQGKTTQIGHTSPNGMKMLRRFEKFKIKYYVAGENLHYGRSAIRYF